MHKLSEMNFMEYSAALAELAEPIGNLANDDAVWEAFRAATAQAVTRHRRRDLRGILQSYAALTPLLFSPEHRMDVMRIISIVQGVPMNELSEQNGQKLLADFFRSYKEQDIERFFTFSGRLGQTGS